MRARYMAMRALMLRFARYEVYAAIYSSPCCYFFFATPAAPLRHAASQRRVTPLAVDIRLRFAATMVTPLLPLIRHTPFYCGDTLLRFTPLRRLLMPPCHCHACHMPPRHALMLCCRFFIAVMPAIADDTMPQRMPDKLSPITPILTPAARRCFDCHTPPPPLPLLR